MKPDGGVRFKRFLNRAYEVCSAQNETEIERETERALMAPDFPFDLINDIKISLRKAAGAPSYDPNDAAIPSLPSIADAVAALDPTLPDYLRCMRCHGGLCRGLKSTLCIFCGTEQRRDGIFRSIFFNSTAGYRKFLQSLDLDGSEIVNLESQSESSESHDSSKGRVPLSEILNLELRWPEADVNNSNNNNGSSKTASLQPAIISLSGANLDNNNIDNTPHVCSSADTNSGGPDEAFADWETGFRSASSIQIDPLLKSSNSQAVNLFVNRETIAADSRRINHAYNSDIEFSSFMISKETAQIESATSSFVGELKNEEKQVTSDDFQQSGSIEIMKAGNLNHGDDDDGSFDAWQDFATAAEMAHVLPGEANSGDVENMEEYGSFKQSELLSACDFSSSECQVDVLLGQLPDLSFMLEESLCVPKKLINSKLR